MATLGIDFDSTPLTLDAFKEQLIKAQDDRVLATWNICDLNVKAKDNPEYEDIYQAYRDDTKISEGSISKYNATIKDFPIDRRKWYMSIEMYYSVSGLRDANGNPLTQVQDNLLAMAYRRKQNGDGARQWLRDEVKKIKREPVTETLTAKASVGSIDTLLQEWHKLPKGYEVEITWTKQVSYEQSELETEIAELEAVA